MKNKCDNCEDFYSCVLGLIESCEYKNEFLKNTDIMNYIKVGKENAITRKELCALTGMEYKAIREEIYRFIGAYITKHVYAPSNKEIAEAVGISGTTVHRHLIDMIDEGILETDAEPGTQRAIRIRNTQVVKRRKKSE